MRHIEETLSLHTICIIHTSQSHIYRYHRMLWHYSNNAITTNSVSMS